MRVKIEIELDVPDDMLVGHGTFGDTMGENVFLAVQKFHIHEAMRAARFKGEYADAGNTSMTEAWVKIYDRHMSWAKLLDAATFKAEKIVD